MNKMRAISIILFFYLLQFSTSYADDNHLPWGENGILVTSKFNSAYELGLLPSEYFNPTFYLSLSNGEKMVVQKGKNSDLETCIAVQIVSLDGSKRWSPLPKLIPLNFSKLNSVIADGKDGFYISAYCQIADTPRNGILLQHFNKDLEPTFGADGVFIDALDFSSEISLRKEGGLFLLYVEKVDYMKNYYQRIVTMIAEIGGKRLLYKANDHQTQAGTAFLVS